METACQWQKPPEKPCSMGWRYNDTPHCWFTTGNTISVRGKSGSSSLNRSHRKTSDKAIQEKIVQDSNGHTGDEAGRHQGAPEIDIAAYEEGGDTHTHGIVRHGRDKRQGVHELLHHQREGKNHH